MNYILPLVICSVKQDRDPSMLKRLNDISKFPENNKNFIPLNAMINSVKLKAIQAIFLKSCF